MEVTRVVDEETQDSLESSDGKSIFWRVFLTRVIPLWFAPPIVAIFIVMIFPLDYYTAIFIPAFAMLIYGTCMGRGYMEGTVSARAMYIKPEKYTKDVVWDARMRYLNDMTIFTPPGLFWCLITGVLAIYCPV